MSVQSNKPPHSQGAVFPAITNFAAASQPLTRLSVVLGQVAAFEFMTVAASTYFSSALYHYFTYGILSYKGEYVGAALFIGALFTALSLGFRHFEMARKRQLHLLLWSGIGAVILVFAIFLSTVFLLKISSDYSRGAFLVEIAGVAITVCVFRAVLFVWLQSAVASGAIEARRAILIGDIDSKITSELRGEGIRVIDTFPFPRDNAKGHRSIDAKMFALDTNVRSTMNVCRTMLPDDVLIFSGQQDLVLASKLAHCLSQLPCNIHIAPLDDVQFLTRSQIADWGSVRTLQVSRRPLTFFDLTLKRIFDIVVATVALVVLSPLLSFVALAIKLDSRGKVLFRQMRHGYNNEEIRVFKFRTMRMTEKSGGVFIPTKENDERITITGQILRRTSIDELPQLLNVLLGEMSIVGPRPHATDHNKMFEDKILPFARRHNVKPGITGWAQVNGCRGPADTVEKMHKRLEYDLFYIDNWSFLFDLKIVLMTLFSKKAYTNAF